ncbi:S8 family serine peptidase [Paraglaciecola aestuariivivens]
MNNFKRRTLPLLSTSVLAAMAMSTSVSAIAGNLQEVDQVTYTGVNAEFAQWRAQQKDAKFQDSTDQIIVEFKNQGKKDKSVKRLIKKLKKSLKDKTKFKDKASGMTRYVFKFDESIDAKQYQEILDLVRSDDNVSFAEMDPVRYLMAETTPWGIPNVQANLLSDNDAGNMTVCIIDSGYEQSNPDLAANNATGTNDSGTGNWYQAGGSHGTHVAGTIAGVNNTQGVVGVLPNTNVNLHIVKVFNEAGWGYSSDLVTAVNTCVNNGAKVVNMSLGGPSYSASEDSGMQSAAAQDVLLVAASGNDGNATLSYPASYDIVMAVGAVDESGKHAEFSQYTAQVEVAAPGEAVLSTVAGDGRLGTITVGSSTYGNDRVVPQTHYIQSAGSYVVSNINGSVSGSLGSCSISGASYSCSNVAGNICVAERNGNQSGSGYPEINPAKACADAGAVGVIVYSNSDRPGLQNPFLVDANNDVNMPAVSVNRTLGLALMGKLGQSTTLTVTGNQDYAYYNGTSMATPHVAGVAALAWSNNIACTASEVRSALKNTAVDLETSGRDDKTGFGLVQAKAASDYLAASCGGSTPPPPPTGNSTLENGVAKTNLSGASNAVLEFTMDVPAGATDLAFAMSGGTGDADLYVKFGSKPTTSSYDCRPYLNGNNENCSFASPQAGTYHVKVIGYSAFNGVSLTGSYTEATPPSPGFSTTVSNISASRSQWKYYTIEIPAGKSNFSVDTYGGSGDADLYIRFGSQPTTSQYDCRPYKSGNTESCSVNNPAAGTWHIGIRAYSTFSGLNMDVAYE